MEISIGKMLRKVKVESPGDSKLLPGEMVDKFKFRTENEKLSKSVVITNPGDSDLSEGTIIAKAELVAVNDEVEESGGESAKGKKPKPASATTLLLGITKASLSSESFISSAPFQDTTQVLTEAAPGGAVHLWTARPLTRQSVGDAGSQPRAVMIESQEQRAHPYARHHAHQPKTPHWSASRSHTPQPN